MKTIRALYTLEQKEMHPNSALAQKYNAA